MKDSSLNTTLADVERAHILTTLAVYEGNRTHAAKALGISVRCLRNKLHVYIEAGFEVPEPQIGVCSAAAAPSKCRSDAASDRELPPSDTGSLSC